MLHWAFIGPDFQRIFILSAEKRARGKLGGGEEDSVISQISMGRQQLRQSALSGHWMV